MVKKNVDKDGLNERSKQQLKNADESASAHARGIAGDPLLEPVQKYIQSSNEKVIQGQNNSWIVLGRDRPASRLSGYGGIGDTQCVAIDIVVGRMGSKPNSEMWTDPDFTKDGARIYISHKTDIDENFSLAEGKVGVSRAKSGIGIKADAVRVIAREGIKLVTGTDGENSQGGVVDTTLGIDIIAGNNEEELQPMVKGQNAAAALDKLVKHVESLSGILSAFLQSQMKFNAAAGSHFHTSPFYGAPTTPSEILSGQLTETQMSQMQDCIVGLQKFKTNLVSYKNTYLRPSGKKYINSRYNSVN
jgi:hypothetical protein